jgi:hypothetical protein
MRAASANPRWDGALPHIRTAGLPEPIVRMDSRWERNHYLAHNGITTYQLRPQIEQLHLPIESLGSLDTLVQRLQDEVAESKTVACWFASVGRGAAKHSLIQHAPLSGVVQITQHGSHSR